MKRAIAVSAAALCVAMTLSSCKGGGQSAAGAGGGASPGAPAATGGTVYVMANAGADFSHLDPARGYDGGVDNFYRLIYRTLTTQAAAPGVGGTKIVGDLATNTGTPSDGDKTWTFTLKSGLSFQNGQPITSQDVKFGVERAWDPEAGIGSPYAKELIAAPASYQGPYKSGDLSTIATPDDRTVVFHLNKPFADFPNVVSQPTFVPFPKGTGAKDVFDTTPIASGPYELASRQPGSSLKLTRNPYWKRSTDSVRSAKPDAFTWLIGLDGATMDERMIAGQGKDIDAISGGVQPATVARIQTPELKQRTISRIQGCTTYMSLNTTKAHLNDVRVRQAIAYAVNKKTAVDADGGTQLASVANSIEPPTLDGYVNSDVYPSKDSAGDDTAARKLLAEAGLSKGFSMTLDTRGEASQQAISVALQQALKQVNINLKINTIDTSTFYEVIGTPSEQHDAALTGWCPDWPSGSTFLPPLFDGRNITNKGNVDLAMLNDTNINARFDQIAAMQDVNQQNAAYGAMDAQIMKLAPIVPILYQKSVVLTGSNIAGAYPTDAFDGGIDLVSVGLADPKK